MLKDIEYIYAVYQERSFSKAAEALSYTPSGVNQLVSALEEIARMLPPAS